MKRQRGIALLTALLAVALAVVLVAALLDDGENARMRTAHALRGEQSWQLLRGLEGWAIRVLRDEDAQMPGVDSRADLWAQPLPPVEVPGGRVGGSLRDLGGCFNLNGLGNVRGADHSGAMLARFDRLLRVLRLDPNIAPAAKDWIDPDPDPETGGAEDMQYRLASPAYRTANRPFAHVSELRLVRGVDPDTYAALLPHVCVLPDEDAHMNLNTATPELWRALHDSVGESVARRMWREGRARYESGPAALQELATLLQQDPEAFGASIPLADVRSSWFVMEAEIEADGLPFVYSSLIERGVGGFRVLARVRGRW